MLATIFYDYEYLQKNINGHAIHETVLPRNKSERVSSKMLMIKVKLITASRPSQD